MAKKSQAGPEPAGPGVVVDAYVGQGGSYERLSDGTRRLLHRTQPAGAPVAVPESIVVDAGEVPYGESANTAQEEMI
jgi:hypothetical protein